METKCVEYVALLCTVAADTQSIIVSLWTDVEMVIMSVEHGSILVLEVQPHLCTPPPLYVGELKQGIVADPEVPI